MNTSVMLLMASFVSVVERPVVFQLRPVPGSCWRLILPLPGIAAWLSSLAPR